MIKRTKLLCFATTLLACAPSSTLHSQDNGTSDYDIFKSFTRCAGYYETMADIGSKSEEKSTIEYIRGLANGSEVAASMLLISNGKDPKSALDISKEMSKVEHTYWTNKLSGDLTGVEATRQRALCTKLNPLQAELVEEWRKLMYGFEAKK